MCSSQRNGDYGKWRWFDYCLYHAIQNLSFCEHGAFSVFTGLNGVKLDRKVVRKGYFVTYVSTSWRRGVSEKFMKGEGMIIQIDKEFKNDDKIYCCDVSWISKFPHECEILFARSIGFGTDGFKCRILDESKGVQTVALTASATNKDQIIDDESKAEEIDEMEVICHEDVDEDYEYEYYDEEFILNQKVRCLYNDTNEWYDASIIEIGEDKILIQYDEYDEEYNEWIPVNEYETRIEVIYDNEGQAVINDY